MEPNKLEKDFKDKLEQRTIQPSEMAWDRLDAMLSVTENKKPRTNRTWMYMAASFLVFLLAGVLFMNQEKENTGLDNNKDGVVTTKGQPQTEIENNETIIVPETNNEAVANKETRPAIQSKKQNTGDSYQGTVNDKTKITDTTQETLAANNIKEPVTIVPVNNAEQLLASAVKQEASKKKTSVKVDSNSLLSSVEEELDDSFKNKVLIGTVKNIKAVSTAVANRNYQ